MHLPLLLSLLLLASAPGPMRVVVSNHRDSPADIAIADGALAIGTSSCEALKRQENCWLMVKSLPARITVKTGGRTTIVTATPEAVTTGDQPTACVAIIEKEIRLLSAEDCDDDLAMM